MTSHSIQSIGEVIKKDAKMKHEGEQKYKFKKIEKWGKSWLHCRVDQIIRVYFYLHKEEEIATDWTWRGVNRGIDGGHWCPGVGAVVIRLAWNAKYPRIIRWGGGAIWRGLCHPLSRCLSPSFSFSLSLFFSPPTFHGTWGMCPLCSSGHTIEGELQTVFVMRVRELEWLETLSLC